MAELERKYAARAEFVLLYTREFNPGIGRFRDLTDPTTLEGRLGLARRLKTDFDAAGRHCIWVVDSMANRLHEAYGSPKGASIVVDAGGRVAFKGAWASPAAVEAALAPLVAHPGSTPRALEAGLFVGMEPAVPVVERAPRVTDGAGLWVDLAPSAPPRAAPVAARAEAPVVAAATVGAPKIASPAPGPARTLKFGVGGMVCQGCAISIREAVAAVPHVSAARLAYRANEPGRLEVDGAPGVDPAAIQAAVRRTGFTVTEEIR